MSSPDEYEGWPGFQWQEDITPESAQADIDMILALEADNPEYDTYYGRVEI